MTVDKRPSNHRKKVAVYVSPVMIEDNPLFAIRVTLRNEEADKLSLTV
ncbi:MAG TPA: hypothetical protein VJ440_10975 [Candidatus Brocadiaceae bacterium]|nr:hypothetical protein [Candidatus Brocadiaceae bacterium]